MYQHFQFDRDETARAAQNIAAVLADTRPDESPERFAATVIVGRLRKAPGDYLQYGPYWWAVKDALRSAGHALGDTDNTTLRAAYGSGLTAHQVFVAGELFRDHYRANLMAGTATFALGGEDDTDEGRYTLFDADMEALRHGLGSAAVAGVGETHAIHEPDEPIFDDVDVQFEEGGELWTAVLDGVLSTEADPAALVADLQRRGHIGRAIDASKGIGAGSSAEAEPAIEVDLLRRVARIQRRQPKA